MYRYNRDFTHSPTSSLQTPPRLLDHVRERIRYRHYSLRTEKVYVFWIRRFIQFHGLKHPKDMGNATPAA
jgi:hypothetical protein